MEYFLDFYSNNLLEDNVTHLDMLERFKGEKIEAYLYLNEIIDGIYTSRDKTSSSDIVSGCAGKGSSNKYYKKYLNLCNNL